ncbi:MAG: hypothetical protein ABR585_05545 [Gemmatimonadaceae bacterium]
MAYRTFVDRDGAYWQVWDSQPTKVERRISESDRRSVRRFPWTDPERRSGVDRRVTNQRRITLGQGYSRGWLTFESLLEKKRLVPIPSHWEESSQADLREFCEKAKSIAKVEGSAGAA